MKRRKKAFIALVLFLAGTPLAILLLINLYIQSESFKTTLENALAEHLHLNMVLRDSTFTPWGGLNATGTSSSRFAENGLGASIKTTQLHADLEILPLFSRHVVLHEVTLQGPAIEWIFKEEAADAQSPEADRVVASPDEPGPVPGEPPLLSPEENLAQRESSPQPPLSVSFHDLKIVDGRLALARPSLKTLVVFEGINLGIIEENPGEFHGGIAIEKVFFQKSLVLADLNSPLVFRGDYLEFTEISAAVASGKLSGNLQLSDLNSGGSFSAQLDFYEINLGRLLKAFDVFLEFDEGQVEGGITLQGQLSNIESVTGNAELIISDVGLPPGSFLANVGQLLDIREFYDVLAKKIQLNGRIAQGNFYLERSEIDTENLKLTAVGTVDLESDLDLSSTLHLSQKLTDKLPKFFRGALQSSTWPDFNKIDFQVTGTLSHPKTNLIEKIVDSKINQTLGGFFKGLDNLLNQPEGSTHAFPGADEQ